MLGAIVGDVAGSAYQFSSSLKREDKLFPLFTPKSHFTDDTVLTVAIAKGIVEGYNDPEKTHMAIIDSMHRYGRRYPDAGYGQRFTHWLLRRSNIPYNSCGNGSAMRVSFIGWAYDALESVEKYAAISASVTHDHPEGIKGACATAAAIFLARSGASKETIRQYISAKYNYNLSKSLTQLVPNYKHYQTCQYTVPRAVIAFLESVSFEDCLRKAIALRENSDTVAAIAGSIAEAFYQNIPDSICYEAFQKLDRRLQYDVENSLCWLYEHECISQEKVRQFRKYFFVTLNMYSLTNNGTHPDLCNQYIRAVHDDGRLLRFIAHQTDAVCMEAVKQNGLALEYVAKQNHDLCMTAVMKNPHALQFVKKQAPELCMAAVKQSGWALEHAIEQTPEICMTAVKRIGWALEFVKEQTPEICMAAVRQNPMVLQFIEEQTEALCMAAVKQDGLALQFVKKQTPELCMAAVTQSPAALQFVRKQTEDMCMTALKQDGLLLRFVREQTPELRMVAVKQAGEAIRFVSEQNPDVCMAAVRQNGLLLRFVKEQTEALCIAAVKQNGHALQFVHNQTFDICTAAITETPNAILLAEEPFFSTLINKAEYKHILHEYIL